MHPSSPVHPRVLTGLPPRLFVLGKDAVDLVHRQALDRIVLVYKHGQGINSDFDFRGLVTIFLLKGVDFRGLMARPHRPQLRRALDQRRRCYG